MLIDQDTKPNNVPLWDLQLRIGGKTFTVREVTLKEFATMRLALPREAEIQQILGLVSDADAGGLRELLEDDDVRDDVTTTIGATWGPTSKKTGGPSQPGAGRNGAGGDLAFDLWDAVAALIEICPAMTPAAALDFGVVSFGYLLAARLKRDERIEQRMKQERLKVSVAGEPDADGVGPMSDGPGGTKSQRFSGKAGFQMLYAQLGLGTANDGEGKGPSKQD